MPLKVNLRHLEEKDLELKGELVAEELDIQTLDELISIKEPLKYDILAQQMEVGLLVTGKLLLNLDCQCVRCLKPFKYELRIDPWTTLLPFEGEDALTVENDCVDLTPQVREDILLEFPQHPLCKPECRGLPQANTGKPKKPRNKNPEGSDLSAWGELDKLKF